MKFIGKQAGELLFERIEEVLIREGLTEKERIPKYRIILEDLFNELTKDVRRHLNGLFAKTSFIFKEYDVPDAVIDKVHNLRIHANKVVHDSSISPRQMDEVRCLFQLAESISYFAKLPVPEEVKKHYADHLSRIQASEKVQRPIKPSYEFHAVVENVFVPDGEHKGRYCVLTCNTDDLGLIKLKLWNNKKADGFGSDLAVFGNLVEPYQNIYVTEVKKYQDEEDEFYATPQSLLVLEPDYLIDAKELSNCRQKQGDNPLLYILSRFTKGEVTDRVMVGNIVGKMLDDIATDPEYDYKKSFEHVMRESSFGMLCMASDNGRYNRTNIEKAFVEARDHEKILKEVLKDFKPDRLVVEPTFISSKFGLQGRLDLLVERKKAENRKDIIELKSTRNYPGLNIGLYSNHKAQAMCYDLLLSSTFPERIGHSSILYSNASLEESPLRHVNEEEFLSKQQLLMTRNEIVASEMKLAKGDFQPFFDILSEDFGPYPKYLEDQLSDFTQTIKGLNGLLKKYFLGYLKFIYRELQVAKVGSSDGYSSSNGFSSLWRSSKAEKLNNYNVLVYLKVKDVTDDFHVTLEMNPDLFSPDVTTFREGDIAILYPTPDPEHLNPLSSQILKCNIRSVQGLQVKVSLTNKQLDKDYFKGHQFWALDQDFRESGFKRMLQLSYEFLKSDERVINLTLGLARPGFEEAVKIPQGEMNPIQHQLVKRALSAKDYFLIQGPPGTGKTSKVLCEIVKQLSTQQKNVMVIAFTNRAIDEVSRKLSEMGVECIRLGKGDKPYHWSNLSGRLKLDELHEKVEKTRVFLSTQAMFTASLDLLKFKTFDTLVVDEASQLLEPQLTGILKHFNRWIFIGDENQLPAVVVQSEEDSRCEDKELHRIGIENFRESLFSRLKKNAISKGWDDCHGMLKVHYRMHEDIAEFPNINFYDNALVPGGLVQEQPIPEYSSFPDDPISSVFVQSRTVFIPTKKDLKSQVNDEEAKLVCELVRFIHKIYGEKFDIQKTVGVITPFRAQVANIRKHLPDQYQGITVDTVERYQGSERDVIIISFAIKSIPQLGAIQSINEQGVDRKLNVAITRAKNHLILLGAEEFLEKGQVFKELISFIKSQNGYVINPLKTRSIPSDLF